MSWRKSEGIAYLNRCFEQGVAWRWARDYTKQRYGVTRDTVNKWREYTKYYKA